MLPSINLQPSEFTAVNADVSPESSVSPDSTTPVTGFAELLNQPLPTVEPIVIGNAGQTLPLGGNILPVDSLEALPEGPNALLQAGLEDPGKNRAMPAPPDMATDLLFPMGSPVNTPPLVPASTIVAERLQSVNPQAGSGALTSDMTALQVKTTVANPLNLENYGAAANSNETQRAAQAAGAGDTIQSLVRSTTAGDGQNGRSVRQPVAGSSVDPLAAMLERPQAQSTLLSGGATPQVNAITSALAASQGPTATTPATLAPAPTSIDIPLNDPAWGDALSDRVLFMTGQKVHSAEIRLNPAEMGPITIKIAVEDGAADVTFSAQHGAAREAIEQAMPRLRELLSDNGLLLGNTSVTDEGVEQEAKGRDAQETQVKNGVAGESLSNDDSQQAIPIHLPQGLVDTFV